MSTLRSVVEDVDAQDVRCLSDDELAEDLTEIERASRILDSARARRIGEVERRGSYADDGHLSVTSWLAHRLGIPGPVASQQVRLSRALPHMPRTAAALAEGEVSMPAVALLVGAREADPEQFDRSEEVLLRAARAMPVRDLRQAVDHWRQLADAAGQTAAAERRFERRGLFVSATMDGMVRIDGDLDPETGQTVMTALRSMVDAEIRSGEVDARRPAQRRADALGEICRRHLDSSDRAVVGAERPHLTVTMDLEALEGRAGGRCELDDAGRITPRAARRLACDASVSRVIVRGASEPLDVGRRTAVVPSSLRRAVIVRDRRCRFPGCDRPHGWCDAHHVMHWADGGRTSLSNLILLCRPHHRLVHERFHLRIVHGRPVFTRADGTVLDDRPPP